ncbi:hypothetical protein Tco_0422303 [Tanacetum coccineum]
MEDDDQAIQTILLGLPKDIYAAVDSCETAQEIWLHIAQPGMNLGQDNQMQMVGGNGGNQFRQFAGQNVGNQVVHNAVQNPGVQNVGNQHGVIIVPGIANQNGNGKVVAARAEGNANRDNASTSGTQSDKAPVYDLDGSAEVQLHDNCYNDEIFNMFTQEERSEQGRGIVEQHPETSEETRAYQVALFHNLVAEVKKVNSVNRKIKETNAELTTELARYKNQKKCFEISQEKYDKLEMLLVPL